MREGQDSKPLSQAEKLLAYQLARDFHHKRIATLFDVNQGRISEAVAEVEEFLKARANAT